MLRRKQELELQFGQINAARPVSDEVEEISPLPSRKDNQKRNYGDLTAAVISVLAKEPLSKREIAHLQAQNFPFAGPSLKVLDSVIYIKHFTRNGKLFSLAKPIK